jgi:lysozyme
MTGLPRGLAALVQRHEGLRLRPYRCPAGFLTIGWGRNLERSPTGISAGEADLLLANDLEATAREVETRWPWTAGLDAVRLAAVLDLAYNLGLTRLAAFGPTLALLEAGDWAGAAARLRRTRWYRQVGTRGERITGMIESGVWPVDVPR